MKHEEKTVKEVKIHNFVVCACKSQDFAQSQKTFALSHDHVTVTFRNSGKKVKFDKSEFKFSSFTWSSLCGGKMNLDLAILLKKKI